MSKRKDAKIKLSVLRESRALSQRELSKETGIPASTIAAYETGNRNPKLENALIFARFFGVPVEQIQYKNI
ncbi:MAG: helix-turn-helix transcriptional regulator [Lachnospiraceae bacterium]|nr:helix-turn-helix transcriptional regulator [Lachnospiraceae bacterium]